MVLLIFYHQIKHDIQKFLFLWTFTWCSFHLPKLDILWNFTVNIDAKDSALFIETLNFLVSTENCSPQISDFCKCKINSCRLFTPIFHKLARWWKMYEIDKFWFVDNIRYYVCKFYCSYALNAFGGFYTHQQRYSAFWRSVTANSGYKY